MANCIHGLREDLCAVCAERSVVARDRALAAADRLAEACIGSLHTSWLQAATVPYCKVCDAALGPSAKRRMGCSGEHEPNCAVAAWLAAREETR